MSSLCGIWGQPYIDLEPFVDVSGLDEIDEEILEGLTLVEPGYTGGSLKWLGVAAPWVVEDEYADLGFVIEGMSRQELIKFVSMGETPDGFDPEQRENLAFGDETDNPLSDRQILYLKYKYGVYFPWKVVYHLLENFRWEDNHSGKGKHWDEEALRVFPKTIELIRSLPFTEIGRCLIFGMEANDHATIHRDSEPGKQLEIAHCVSICPRKDKRFFLLDPEGREQTFVESRAYWFNDMDYHGVEPDPFFRYSIRIDGRFDPAFLRELEAAHRIRG